MRTVALLTAFLFSTVAMAGCMDLGGGGGSDYTPRTREFIFVVPASTSDTIELYTKNDGEMMSVVALGFQESDQERLEVPNPEIRAMEGDTVIVRIINNNPLMHTFHWHGGLVEWEMDGVPYLNQMPIHQGEEFEYVFENVKAGTYWYHCHVDVAHHIDLGMYGAFIVEEREPQYEYDREFVLMLDEWDNCHVHGNRDPVDGSEQSGEFSNRAECLERFLQDNLAQNQASAAPRNALCAQNPPEPLYSQLQCDSHMARPPQQTDREWYPTTFPVYAPIYNTYLINGKAFPDTETLPVQEGEAVRIRLINVGEQMHSMHLHGHNFLVTHRDGYALNQAAFRADTLGIMPGERYDLLVRADNPGLWAFHDHVGLNVMNDDHSPGGMFTCLAYQGFHGFDALNSNRALDCIDYARTQIHAGHDHGTRRY